MNLSQEIVSLRLFGKIPPMQHVIKQDHVNRSGPYGDRTVLGDVDCVDVSEPFFSGLAFHFTEDLFVYIDRLDPSEIAHDACSRHRISPLPAAEVHNTITLTQTRFSQNRLRPAAKPLVYLTGHLC